MIIEEKSLMRIQCDDQEPYNDNSSLFQVDKN